jgi:hypothetical protein
MRKIVMDQYQIGQTGISTSSGAFSSSIVVSAFLAREGAIGFETIIGTGGVPREKRLIRTMLEQLCRGGKVGAGEDFYAVSPLLFCFVQTYVGLAQKLRNGAVAAG